MGNDMFNDEQLAHAEIVQKETEDALGFWKDRALKAEAKLADKYLIEEQYETACGDRDGLLRMVETLREQKAALLAERDALLSKAAPPADAATPPVVHRDVKPESFDEVVNMVAQGVAHVRQCKGEDNLSCLSPFVARVEALLDAVQLDSFDDGYLVPPINCGTFADITPAVAEVMNAHSLSEMRPPTSPLPEFIAERLRAYRCALDAEADCPCVSLTCEHQKRVVTLARFVANAALDYYEHPSPAPPADAATEAAPTREQLLQRVEEDNAVCICGCPPEDHEDNGEDGESCSDPWHQCIRVCRTAAELYRQATLTWHTTCARCGRALAIDTVTCGECCAGSPANAATEAE